MYLPERPESAAALLGSRRRFRTLLLLGLQLFLLLGLSRPEGFSIHELSKMAAARAAIASDQNGDKPSSIGAVVSRQTSKPRKRLVTARWERPSLAGDHGSAEVDAFGPRPANGRQQSSCRCGNGHHGCLGHHPLHGTIAEAQVRRGGRHGPDRRQDRRYGDRGQLDARQ